jgi:hypothetical protein
MNTNIMEGAMTVDSLAPLSVSPFAQAVTKLEDLMSQTNRAFLLGAGCSRCAGLPLASELTGLILKEPSLSVETKGILTSLTKHFEGAKNAIIEDFMSELVDLLAIAERRNERGAKATSTELSGKTYTIEQLHASLLEIKEKIADCIEHRQADVSTHWQFVKAVHRVLRSGKASANCAVDYIVLNYDTLIEDALALERLDYSDGFCGGSTAYWVIKSFSDSCTARVLKIHGSIDWCELTGEVLPCRIRSSLKLPTDSKKKVLIWPAATKYRETQNDPYAQILEIVRRTLRPPTNSEVVLTVCGYRFGDSHINIEIDRALRESNKALTVVVFTGMEKPEGKLKEWIDDATIKDQVLVYAKRGFFHGSNAKLTDKDLPWWKFENLTRLLSGER